MLHILVAIFLLIAVGCETKSHSQLQKCRKFLVAPAPHIDEFVSTTIVQFWINEVTPRLPQCHKILSYEQYSDSFNTVNIDHLTENPAGSFSPSQGRSLKKRTAASHVVFLSMINYRDRTYIKPKFISLDTGLPAKEPYLDYIVPFEYVPQHDESGFVLNSWLIQSISIFPNTALIGLSDTRIFNEDPIYGNSSDISREEDISLFPPILSSFSVTSVLHPEGFDTFDFTTRFYPSLGVGSLKRRYHYQQNPNVNNESRVMIEQYDVSILFTYVTFNYEINLFSPLGVTFFSFGYGPGYSSSSDNQGYSRSQIIDMSTFVFGHRVHLGERLFFQLSSESLTARPAMINSRFFKSGDYHTNLLQLGYFFPELRSYIRRRL